VNGVVEQLALGVGASAITGAAVWSYQRVRTAARGRTRRAFLGLPAVGRARARLIVGRSHRAEGHVNQFDMAAMLEIALLLRDVPAGVSVLSVEEARAVAADQVEFCVGGPLSNTRTASIMRRYLPGIQVRPATPERPQEVAVGPTVYRRDRGREEYVLLARVCRPGRPPVFLVAGQTAVTNQAAAARLAAGVPALRHRFGDERTFALLLRVLDPQTHGHHEVEEVADITADALRQPSSPPPSPPPSPPSTPPPAPPA
jgi:hypothetical protein